jgi:hypothetical protein
VIFGFYTFYPPEKSEAILRDATWTQADVGVGISLGPVFVPFDQTWLKRSACYTAKQRPSMPAPLSASVSTIVTQYFFFELKEFKFVSFNLGLELRVVNGNYFEINMKSPDNHHLGFFIAL